MRSSLLHFPPFRLDSNNERLWRETIEIPLRPKTFAVLRYLVEHSEQLVTKEELLNAVWGETVVGEDALTGCIRDLRKVLGDEARRPQYIETVHRRGFRFIGTVVSDQLSVVSQEEEGSSQDLVVSQEEPSANEQERDVNGQERDAVMPALRPSSGQAFAGMTQPVLNAQIQPDGVIESETQTGSLSSVETLDPRPQTRAVATSARAWPRKGLLLIGLFLLVGALAIVRKVPFSIRTPQSPLRNQEALPLPDKPSLIVLPLVNLSGDAEQDYFSDGLTEVLTGSLSRISGLFVIARNSAFTYKGKAAKVQEVSKEMGVRYVLEGSVQRAEQRVRIAVQLIDATTGYHVWSEQYDRSVKDLFVLQDEIVQKIVTTLKLQLTLEEEGIIVRKTTENLEAYDACLRGMEYFWRLTKDANAQARQQAEKAIALDPQYAGAVVLLSATYWTEWLLRWSTDPQTLERALTFAQQALALDDSLPTAHAALSNVYTLKQQYDQAIAESDRAIALDPNNADSYSQLSMTLIFAGRYEEALRAAEQAIRLNPHLPPIYLFFTGIAYRFSGQYAKAIPVLKEVIRRNPNDVAAHNNLAASYWLQWASQLSPAGQTLEPAAEIIHQALTLNDTWFWVHIFAGYIALYQQQYDQALAEMQKAVALAPMIAESYAALAEVLSCMGRTAEALDTAAQSQQLKDEFAEDHIASIGTAYAIAGHYEEARPLLQRSLSRYPNILRIHLTLATVYNELGQDGEAQKEAAEVLRLNPKFSLEVHKQRMPIKDPAVLERHLAALRKAGLR